LSDFVQTTTRLGSRIIEALEDAARFSTTERGVTRFFCTPEHRALVDWLRARMEEAGLSASLDDAGNLVGRLAGPTPDSPVLILGSHQDSVRQGGKFDGMLGIVVPIACMAEINATGPRLPFAIEVIAFGDEEGGRFQSTLVGSRAIAGRFEHAALTSLDSTGTSMAQAMRDFGLAPERIGTLARDPARVLGFVEVHIEQGPILEREGLPVGVVTAITGIERHKVRLIGRAGHAGTTPMVARRDALAAAAELVLFVERLCRETDRLVGVVGELSVEPGAVNVIPACCSLTVELRSPERTIRGRGRAALGRELERLQAERGVASESRMTYEADGVACSRRLAGILEEAVRGQGLRVKHLFSGAGHDGLAMKDLTEIAMLFVRCRDGLSHHPDEAIDSADAEVAARVLISFLEAMPVSP
jgi:allantoate deiminase